MTSESAGASSSPTNVSHVQHVGKFVWEPGTKYGFIINLDGEPGVARGYFLHLQTILENRKGDLRHARLAELDRQPVKFFIRTSQHPRHQGKLEAWQVSRYDWRAEQEAQDENEAEEREEAEKRSYALPR